jgi:hypothetical protein
VTKDRWEAWVFAPRDIPEEDLQRFKSGSYAWRGAPGWRESLDYLVRAMELSSATFVVPEGMGRPGDPWLQHNESPTEIVTAGDDLYWVVREPDAAAVAQAWSDGASAAGVIGLVTQAVVPDTEASRDDLRRIAREASLVAFSAYDSTQRVIFLTPRG